MASSLHQNSTFLKPYHSQSPNPSTSTTTRRSYIPVRCGGPRSQRGPLVRGRFLSIEAIQAIQTLKRIHRTKPQDQSKLLTNTLTRLIKSDLVATLKELLRQQQCTLALDVFSAVRSEYGADLSLYAEMVQALGNCDMVEDVDRLIEEIVGEGGIGIGCGEDQGKGLLNLIKAVIGAKRRDSTGFGDEELAQQILNDYDSAIISRSHSPGGCSKTIAHTISRIASVVVLILLIDVAISTEAGGVAGNSHSSANNTDTDFCALCHSAGASGHSVGGAAYGHSVSAYGHSAGGAASQSHASTGGTDTDLCAL
ncbi:hypothetical protein P8452_73644 [Trifolium repens]|nr:hypothetical protein P8452_73644 [Trifolium repens]